MSKPRIANSALVIAIAITALLATACTSSRKSESFVAGKTSQLTNDPGLEVQPDISRDGKMVAYAVGPWAKSRIYVKQLTPGGSTIPLTDTSHAAQWPRFSPDGTKILYTSANRSYIISTHGGPPSPFGGKRNLVFCAWSNSGDKIACRDFNTGALVVLGSNGENPRDISATGGQAATIAPVFSPDDKFIAYVRDGRQFLNFSDVIGDATPCSIWIVPAAGGTPVKVTDNTHLNTSPLWTADGNLLYISSLQGGRDVFLQHISKDLKTTGEPVRLTTGLNPHTIALSPNGNTLTYSVLNATPSSWRTPITGASVDSPRLEQVASIPPSKTVPEKPSLLRGAPFSAIAPDGKQAVAVTAGGVICRDCPGGMYWLKLDGSEHKPVDLTTLMKVIRNPGEGAWSVDSRHAYLTMREMDGTSSIWRLPVNSDTAQRMVHLTDPSRQLSRMSLTIDDKYFYITLDHRQSDIWTMELKKQ